jgi:hypothetical protein
VAALLKVNHFLIIYKREVNEKESSSIDGGDGGSRTPVLKGVHTISTCLAVLKKI